MEKTILKACPHYGLTPNIVKRAELKTTPMWFVWVVKVYNYNAYPDSRAAVFVAYLSETCFCGLGMKKMKCKV